MSPTEEFEQRALDDIVEKLVQARELEFQGKYHDCEQAATGLIHAVDSLQHDSLSDDAISIVGRELSNAYNLRGLALRMQGRPDEAMSDYREAQRFAGNSDQLALTIVNIADIYRGKRDFASAYERLSAAVELVSGSGAEPVSPYALIKAIDQRGLVFVAEGRFVEAVNEYDHARSLLDKHFPVIMESSVDRDVVKLRANVLQHLGIGIEYAKAEERYSEAFQINTEAVRLSSSIGDVAGMVNAVTAAARLNAQCKKHDEAVKLYWRAWKAIRETDYDRGKATVLLHLSHSLLSLGGEALEEAQVRLDMFMDFAERGCIPPGDYRIMAPYVDGVAELCQRHAISVSGLDGLQKKMRGE